MENHTCAWLVIITVLSACTCGVRPACNGPTQISVLTGVHDDPACRKLSSRGVLLFEAAKFLAETHNNKSNAFKIELQEHWLQQAVLGQHWAGRVFPMAFNYGQEMVASNLPVLATNFRPKLSFQQRHDILAANLRQYFCRCWTSDGPYLTSHLGLDIGLIDLAVMDTCGSIAGAMKAAMKALVRADVNCLQPPYYLGIIGPDTMTNAEAVQKITSVLRVPQIVRKASNSPFLHHLPKESDAYIVRTILKTLNALNWKTFTLVTQRNENDDDNVQNIAKKLTMEAIAKDLCVLVHDDEEEDDFSSQIVHIGKPNSGFFAGPVNATILVVSEGNLEPYLNRINTTNAVLLLEDGRNDFDGLERRVQKSKWWAEESAGKYDTEELRDVRWLQDAVEIYTNAFENVCKKKKCKNQVNPTDWNNALTNELSTQTAEAQSASIVMEISIKVKNAKLAALGRVKVEKNKANILWGNGKNDSDEDDDSSADDDDEDEKIPSVFKKLISKGKETRSGCATSTKVIKSSFDDDEDEATHVYVSEMDDSEWWTMVMTVSGVGVSMFTIGILAVYIIYSNIRGLSD